MTNRLTILAQLDDKVSTGLGKIRDNFDRLGKTGGFKQFTQGLGMGAGIQAWNMLGSAVGGVAEFAQESIQKASALNETLSKSNTVFGASSGTVERWGKTLATSFGISRQAGIEAAASFGNVFVGLDMSEQQAAKMSKRLVELAGDLASFNNIDTGTALEKLRAGLAGEAEPLRAVGVFLTEAKVKAKAMEMGLAGAHGELSEGAKIMARYQLILEETTTAQGDYARTADELANSQRTANAQMEDAQALMGEKLLPIQLQITRAQLSFISQLTLSTDAYRLLEGQLSLTEVGMDRYRAAVDEVTAGTFGLDEASQALVDDAKRVTTSFDASAEGTKEYGDELIGLRQAANKVEPAMHGVRREAAKTARAFDDVTDAAGRWSDWIYGNVQGVDDLKHELDLANSELKEERDRLRELEAIKNPTKDQRQDIKETRVSVDTLERRTFHLNAQLSALGHRPSRDAMRPYLNSLFDKMRLGIITAKEYRAALDALGFRRPGARQTGKDSRGRHGNENGNAYGGQLMTNMAYLVGEKGPELFVPRGSGELMPNHRLGGMTAGGSNLIVNVFPPAMSTPATVRAWADEAGPGLYDYLYRRGALTRAG